MKKTYLAWPVAEILASAFLSFVGSFIFGLFAWMMLLRVEGEGGPGDGIGFIIILFFVIPIWLIFLLIGIYWSNIKFEREKEDMKRVVFSSILPIVVTTITSAFVTIVLLN